MGEDFQLQKFSSRQKSEFVTRVKEECELLRGWFKDSQFEKDHCRFGYESEAWLVDENFLPAPKNEEFLSKLDDPEVVTELAKFNFELNGGVFDLSPDCFFKIEDEFKRKDREMRSCASQLNLNPIWIGILPTVRDEMLCIENISEKNRYYELAREIMALRKNQPIPIHINRFDDVDLLRKDIMLESAATSLQIHTQIDQESSVAMFNAAQLIAAPLLALTANSPFLFGKKLWDETRIPVFEQTIAFKDANSEVHSEPVSFGSDYIKESWLELFEENIEEYPIIMPVLFEDQPESLRHLKFLNGQIWRWNRPIVGTGSSPHLRLEHRSMPAGPSLTDMVANMAIYVGLLYYYGKMNPGWQKTMNFASIKDNFYQCGKLGMKADVSWPANSETTNVQKLLFETLMEQAKEALSVLGISKDSISYYIDDVIRNRTKSGWTGAAWQKSFIDTHGADFQEMTKAYLENQVSLEPVYKWKV